MEFHIKTALRMEMVVHHESYLKLVKNAPSSALKIFGVLMIRAIFEVGIKKATQKFSTSPKKFYD